MLQWIRADDKAAGTRPSRPALSERYRSYKKALRARLAEAESRFERLKRWRRLSKRVKDKADDLRGGLTAAYAIIDVSAVVPYRPGVTS